MRTPLAAILLVTACTDATPRPEPKTEPSPKPKVEPKTEAKPDAGDDKGLADKVREIAGGTKGELPEGVQGVAVPKPVPAGDIVVMHQCSHSMQPFGTGYWSATTTVDLVKKTLQTRRVDGDTDPSKASEKVQQTLNVLTAGDVTRIRAALDDVLGGGPYEQVHAVSEGIVCTLSLRIGDAEPFFAVDKCDPEGEDAVTRLIAELRVSPAP